MQGSRLSGAELTESFRETAGHPAASCSAGISSGGRCQSLLSPPSQRYTTPASAAPMIGAIQNNQSWLSAQP